MNNRREFITRLGGAAAWPLPARAQPGKLPTVGLLGTSTLSAWSVWTAAFVQRLRELGWIEGRTVAIEYRWAEGRNERFAEIAAEFVRLKVDVILTLMVRGAIDPFRSSAQPKSRTATGAQRAPEWHLAVRPSARDARHQPRRSCRIPRGYTLRQRFFDLIHRAG
jgi:hypothetical protein